MKLVPVGTLSMSLLHGNFVPFAGLFLAAQSPVAHGDEKSVEGSIVVRHFEGSIQGSESLFPVAGPVVGYAESIKEHSGSRIESDRLFRQLNGTGRVMLLLIAVRRQPPCLIIQLQGCLRLHWRNWRVDCE